MTAAPLTADRVAFAYPGRAVLRGVSFHVRAGEFVGLVGVNGSGKSTLLRSLLGLLPADGDIRLLGDPPRSLSRREVARRAALVPQDGRIDFAFTGREVVAMGRTPHLGRFTPERDADRHAVDEAMRLTGTSDFAGRPATELSGGELRRLHVARALAQQTPLLLLDEPTANLDLAFQFETLGLVRGLCRAGRAALAAVHDLSLAARFCDRLLLLAGGVIAHDGPPAEVVTEENLKTHFGVNARVLDAGGDLFIAPAGATH